MLRAAWQKRLLLGIAVPLALVLGIGWAPIEVATRNATFEIPPGTWERRMAGNPVEILPAEIHLTLGVQDVLVLNNKDSVPQTFGPTLMMPGQSFSLPFAQAASYQFACTAHASGQMNIIVDPEPSSILARAQWRVRAWLKQI